MALKKRPRAGTQKKFQALSRKQSVQRMKKKPIKGASR